MKETKKKDEFGFSADAVPWGSQDTQEKSAAKSRELIIDQATIGGMTALVAVWSTGEIANVSLFCKKPVGIDLTNWLDMLFVSLSTNYPKKVIIDNNRDWVIPFTQYLKQRKITCVQAAPYSPLGKGKAEQLLQRISKALEGA